MNEHEQFYRQAMRRIYLHLAWVSAAGAIAALLWQGWEAGLGFAAGAGATTLNFRWLHRMVDALGVAKPARGKARLAWLLGFRYLLFGLAAYVIVKYFRINAVALVTGLLVVVPAVMLEILYEIIYART